ncbi:MAG: YicC/YloC family endoribonuclease [Bacteroidia bacterium]
MVQIKSMTGFGASETENENWRIRTEIKSLNNKFFDLNLRLPKAFKDKDIELRQLLNNKINRGSVSVQINAEKKDTSNANDALSVNLSLAKSYYQMIQEISTELNIDSKGVMTNIISFPDVIKYDDSAAKEEDWEMVKDCLIETFLKFDEFRLQEGKTIGAYLKTCIDKIKEYLQAVEKEELPRREGIKGKLLQSLNDNKEDISVDQNRFEQEIIYYLEKYDIGEEKSRLYHHIDFFVECLDKDANGKKLNFIAQEMGREINTIGSKAYFFPIQQSVVLMKEELEKVKEQLLNVL